MGHSNSKSKQRDEAVDCFIVVDKFVPDDPSYTEDKKLSGDVKKYYHKPNSKFYIVEIVDSSYDIKSINVNFYRYADFILKADSNWILFNTSKYTCIAPLWYYLEYVDSRLKNGEIISIKRPENMNGLNITHI